VAAVQLRVLLNNGFTRHTSQMPRRMPALLLLLFPLAASAQPIQKSHQQPLIPHQLPVANGRTITLSLPRDFQISVALTGLRRVRFFAMAPDHRLFVTDMYNRTDNNRGTVYILDGWNAERHTFTRAIPYLQNLRNPNNLAFYTDPSGQQWLYLPLTDRLLRFRYKAGDTAPSSAPEVLARYPDYGLNYKYGGWHLTRTVEFGRLHKAATTADASEDSTRGSYGGSYVDKLFVTVGSSCNACIEKEPIRASMSVMNPDGSGQHIVAKNLRNAVAMQWDAINNTLYATNMGDDQLGNHAPEDPFFAIPASRIEHALATNQPLYYGWPYCYFENGTVHPDPVFGKSPKANCSAVPPAYTTFTPHSSPLGFALFPSTDTLLSNTVVVALHGAGHPRIGTGYKLVRFTAAETKSGHRTPQDFLTGFYQRTKIPGKPDDVRVLGRPCGIYRTGPDSFLLTDDIQGTIYAIYSAHP
jgi:glucose/arabinose dehydrogenase